MVDHRREASSPAASGQAQSGDEGVGGLGEGDRVAKALARAGVASRRAVERLIAEGRVALNGRVLDTPAVKVGPDDILTVDGAVVGEAEAARVWRYHKPAGLLTSHADPAGRPTVFAALPTHLPRVISIGRLDLASEGLLLLTNDGGLARALELPATAWIRRYRVRAYGRVTQARLDELQGGVTVDGVAYGPIEARIDKAQTKGEDAPANLWISIAVAEGKNREVRRVLESLGLKVNRLIRLAYGPFALGTLALSEVEEVGPRVIREQLAEFIAPGRLPTGDRAIVASTSPNAPGDPKATGRRAGPSKGAVEIESPRAARQARRKHITPKVSRAASERKIASGKPTPGKPAPSRSNSGKPKSRSPTRTGGPPRARPR